MVCIPIGRVDQLEDRYLGMVEAPSSNLGTSTIDDFIMNHSSQWWPCCHDLTGYCLAKSLARHVHQKQHTTSPSDPGQHASSPVRVQFDFSGLLYRK